MTGGARSRAVVTALVGYPAGLRLVSRLPGEHRWRRTNYRGRPVTLLGGPAYVTAVVAAATAGGGGLPALVAAGAAAGVGSYDDLAGSATHRGLRGHAAALRNGDITTGMLKLAGMPAGAVVAAVLARRRASLDALVDGLVVAAAANLANLLDLRPGRALKVVVVAGTTLAAAGGPGSGVAAAVAATGVAALPADLAERTMLGDTGANTAGALVGLAAAARLARPARVALAGVLTALTVLSEKVSFTAVIEATPALRRLDELGRAA